MKNKRRNIMAVNLESNLFTEFLYLCPKVHQKLLSSTGLSYYFKLGNKISPVSFRLDIIVSTQQITCPGLQFLVTIIVLRTKCSLLSLLPFIKANLLKRRASYLVTSNQCLCTRGLSSEVRPGNTPHYQNIHTWICSSDPNKVMLGNVLAAHKLPTSLSLHSHFNVTVAFR